MNEFFGYFFVVLAAMALSLYIIFWMLINRKIRRFEKEE